MNFFWEIINNIETFAEFYNVNFKTFVLIYFLSFIPIYFGFFLIFFGTSRQISFKRIIRLDFKNIKPNKTVIIGIIISIFGWIAPFVFILFWGRNLPPIFYFVFWVIILFIIFFVPFFKIKRIFYNKKIISADDIIEIEKKEIISDKYEKERVWEIYNSSFAEINKNVPCKQSLNKDYFLRLIERPDVFKYIVYTKDKQYIIGIGMFTNNLNNTLWISEEYFREKFKNHFEKKIIYYFMGVAIADGYRHKGYAKVLIKRMISDLPDNAIVGFDHSKKVNFFIPNFANFISGRKKKLLLDSQNYYIVLRK